MRSFLWTVLFGLLTLAGGFPAAQAATTTLTWHGHAAFEIATPSGKVLFIDPWLKNPLNPAAQGDRNPIAGIAKADYILLTHGHFDHVGDAVELAKKTGARLVATFELGSNLAKLLGYPKEQMGFDTLMNIGGEIGLADGEIRVAMTPAFHSSAIQNPKAGDKDPDLVDGGNPVGLVVIIKDGPTIYHTGDTAYFSDMRLIADTYRPDVALINIGGHFGMEAPMAAQAAAAVRAPLVIPHHYKTFPVLAQDAEAFTAAMKKKRMAVSVLKPGESIVFEGKKPVRK